MDKNMEIKMDEIMGTRNGTEMTGKGTEMWGKGTEMWGMVEAMGRRRSVRTYEEREVEDEALGALMEMGRRIEGESGVRIRWATRGEGKESGEGERLGTYGMVKGARTFMGVATERSRRGAMEAGYEMERMVLAATRLGLGTVWLGVTFTRSRFEKAMGIEKGEYFPAIVAVGYEKKMRWAEKAMRAAAGSDKRKRWDELFFDKESGQALTAESAGEWAEALEMLRKAPSAMNGQPWRVVKDGDTMHFYAKYKDGISEDEELLKMTDMGIGLCHFELTRREKNGEKGRYYADAEAKAQMPAGWHYAVSRQGEKISEKGEAESRPDGC